LTKISGATSLGDLTGLPKEYRWNVASGCGSPSTFPEYSITLTTPYTVSGVYIMKGLISAGFSKHIEVYVDNVLCGTLTDKNAVASYYPI
jgi:hypothetical protein